MKLSVIVPAYNEQKRIGSALQNLFALNWTCELEVIVVNDGSSDGTGEVLLELINLHPEWQVQTITQANQGKSVAIKHGLAKTKGDWVVVYDADLEYDPQDLQRMVQMALASPTLDAVYGNRFGQRNPVVYWQYYLGNRLLSFCSGLLTWLRGGIFPHDLEVCFKLIRGDIFRELGTQMVSKSMFGLEPEITARLARYRHADGTRVNFAQVPISYTPRTFAEGKNMRAVRDGLLAVVEILRFNLLPLPNRDGANIAKKE